VRLFFYLFLCDSFKQTGGDGVSVRGISCLDPVLLLEMWTDAKILLKMKDPCIMSENFPITDWSAMDGLSGAHREAGHNTAPSPVLPYCVFSSVKISEFCGQQNILLGKSFW